MGIQTYSSVSFILAEQILDEEHDTDPSVMRTSGKQVSNSIIRLSHQIVDDN
jgi:hypothetical protein